MRLTEQRYENADFSDEFLEGESLSRQQFVHCNFSGADFTDLLAVSHCTFDNCGFSGAELGGVDFLSSAFLSCSFRFAACFAARFVDCKMTGSAFCDADSLSGIDGGDWSYTDLRMLQFTKETFRAVNFFGADFSGCRFDRCRFDRCELEEIQTAQTVFTACDLRGSTLRGFDLAGISLPCCKVDLSQCVSLAEIAFDVRYIPEK